MGGIAIYVFAKWRVKAGMLREVMNLLEEVVIKSANEKGNLLYQINQSLTDPDILMLYEVYSSEDALADHRNSEHFRDLVKAKIIPMLEAREVLESKALLFGI